MEKTEKKNKNCASMCVTIGFWSMLVLFALMLSFSLLKWTSAGLAAGILFVLSVFFVFVTSIIAIVPPEKRMEYIALGIAILFLLYILLSATIGGTSVV